MCSHLFLSVSERGSLFGVSERFCNLTYGKDRVAKNQDFLLIRFGRLIFRVVLWLVFCEILLSLLHVKCGFKSNIPLFSSRFIPD